MSCICDISKCAGYYLYFLTFFSFFIYMSFLENITEKGI